MTAQDQPPPDKPPEPPATRPKPLPALGEKASDLAALRDAVVESAGVGAGLWISYLGVLLYLLVAAGGVSHRDLFFETPAKLPFLSVDLPLVGFFVLAPALFLIVHAYVLLHFGLLSNKVGAFDRALREQIEDTAIRTQVRRQLPSNIFVQFLAGPRDVRDGLIGLMLWLIALITLVAAPVALLVFLTLQFLPYHDEAVTWWQRVAVGLDLLLIWLFWPRVAGLDHQSEDQAGTTERMARIQRGLTLGAMYGLTGLAALLLLVFATFPGERLDAVLWPQPDPWLPAPVRAIRVALIAGDVNPATRKPESLWSNRLVLSGLNVPAERKLDSPDKLAAASESISLRNRNLDGAVLIGADLRKADLVGASLRWAIMLGADLTEAQLGCIGTWIGGEAASGAVPERAPICARLDGAILSAARLSGVEASGAVFQGAEMFGAELFGARLLGASFAGTSLAGATLDAAVAAGALFHAANMRGTSLRGAYLFEAQFQASDLTDARLDGAILDKARLQGTTLENATLTGASLSEAYVWRSDARAAKVTAADLRTRSERRSAPCVSPARTGDCEWGPQDYTAWRATVETTLPAGWLRDLVLIRSSDKLDPAKPDDPAVMRWWADARASPASQEAVADHMAREWMAIACQAAGAPHVARALAGIVLMQSPDGAESRLPARRILTRLLDPGCLGAKDIRADTRSRLKDLVETMDDPTRK